MGRWQPNGTRDVAFGGTGAGVFTWDLVPSYWDLVAAIAIQPDGKIVAVGWTGAVGAEELMVLRLNP